MRHSDGRDAALRCAVAHDQHSFSHTPIPQAHPSASVMPPSLIPPPLAQTWSVSTSFPPSWHGLARCVRLRVGPTRTATASSHAMRGMRRSWMRSAICCYSTRTHELIILRPAPPEPNSPCCMLDTQSAHDPSAHSPAHARSLTGARSSLPSSSPSSSPRLLCSPTSSCRAGSAPTLKRYASAHIFTDK